MDAAATQPTPVARWLLIAAIVLGAFVFIGVPMWELIVPGPFDWHIGNESFWQGGIEALVLIALVATGFALKGSRWPIMLIALPAVLYLRRHAVDAPMFVDVLYFEIIVGLGMCLRRLSGVARAVVSLDYALAFVSGFACWSVCAWSASVFDLGSPSQLRWLTLLLAIPAIFGGQRPFLAFLWQRVGAQARADRVWCGALAAWMLVLFARSGVAIGSDTLWYGLRSPFVLVPGHSIYEALALTSPVHYYPKIYEMFLLPLNGLRDYSVIDAMSALLLLPMLLTCRLLMRKLGTPLHMQLPLLALIATLPALANLAIEAKPDVFATLFVVLALFFAVDVVGRRSLAAIAWMLTSVAIACSAKLTAIPYCGILLLATLAATLQAPAAADPARASAHDPRWALGTFVLAAVAAIFVMLRTLLLSGLPTIGPDPLFKLWLALGFKLKEPAGTLDWTAAQNWPDVPALLFDELFRPYVLPNVVVTWVGNVWLWFGMIALIAAGLGLRRGTPGARVTWPAIALMATGIGLAIGNRYLVRGGDGNYFLFALLPAIVCAGTAASTRLVSTPRVLAVLLACVPAFVMFQASYSFISAAWTTGTRAWDLDFSRSPRGMRRRRQSAIDYFGMPRIAAFLAELPHNSRVTGAVEPSVANWLPTRYEDLLTVFYSRPEYIGDPMRIRHFLNTQRITYVIMPRAEVKNLSRLYQLPATVEAATQLAALPGVRRVDDRRYYLLDLSRVDAAVLDPGPVPQTTTNQAR